MSENKKKDTPVTEGGTPCNKDHQGVHPQEHQEVHPGAETFVTLDLVRKFYYELVSKNVVPTIRKVKEQIGKGSYTTASKYFKEVDAAYKQAQFNEILKRYPGDAYIDLLSKDIATKAYSLRIEQYESQLKELSNLLLTNSKQHADEVTALLEENETLNQRISQNEEKFSEMEKKIEELSENLKNALNDNEILKNEKKEQTRKLEFYLPLQKLLSKISEDPELIDKLLKKDEKSKEK